MSINLVGYKLATATYKAKPYKVKIENMYVPIYCTIQFWVGKICCKFSKMISYILVKLIANHIECIYDTTPAFTNVINLLSVKFPP